MAITATAALWYLPFVLPICLYVAFTDLREMRITNQAVMVLAGLFLILGLITLPLPDYAWRLSHPVGRYRVLRPRRISHPPHPRRLRRSG